MDLIAEYNKKAALELYESNEFAIRHAYQFQSRRSLFRMVSPRLQDRYH